MLHYMYEKIYEIVYVYGFSFPCFYRKRVMMPLCPRIRPSRYRVRIYKHLLDKTVEVYDLRAA